MLFGIRQLADEARNGLKDLQQAFHDRPKLPSWAWYVAPHLKINEFAGELVGDVVFDLVRGAASYVGMSADVYGRQAQGDFEGAAKAQMAGLAGIFRESLIVQVGMRINNPVGWAMGTVRDTNRMFDLVGSWDKEAFERGQDTAALFDTVAMLPLDLIGVGEVATAATRTVAAKLAKQVAWEMP